MSAPTHFSPHLEALAKVSGLPFLDLDAQGFRTLTIDSLHSVHLQSDVVSGELVLFAEVATLPSPPDAQLLTLLLQANCFWRGTAGATLSLDDQSPPGLVLARRVSCAAITPAQFVDIFESFVDHLVDWHARLKGASEGDDARQRTEHPGLPGGLSIQFA